QHRRQARASGESRAREPRWRPAIRECPRASRPESGRGTVAGQGVSPDGSPAWTRPRGWRRLVPRPETSLYAELCGWPPRSATGRWRRSRPSVRAFAAPGEALDLDRDADDHAVVGGRAGEADGGGNQQLE